MAHQVEWHDPAIFRQRHPAHIIEGEAFRFLGSGQGPRMPHWHKLRQAGVMGSIRAALLTWAPVYFCFLITGSMHR